MTIPDAHKRLGQTVLLEVGSSMPCIVLDGLSVGLHRAADLLCWQA